MYNILEKITDEKEKKILKQYIDNLPLDVIGLAKALGLAVKESNELPDKISGFIKKNNDEVVVICVNERHHINRKRLTVAHELGHYFLHKDKLEGGIIDGIDILYRDGALDDIEKEANDFGANLLMPEDIFKEKLQQSETIQDMARFFYVSESAIITRAKFLNLAKEYSTYFA
jgi:Zn-dependent peptidase ImmA (M78 family)